MTPNLVALQSGRPVGLTSPFGLWLVRSVSLAVGVWIGVQASPAVGQELDGADRTDGAPGKLPPEELAAWIDGRFAESWKTQGIEPAPPTTDSEFVRRAFLDLIGRIPSVAEGRAFLDDARPDK